MERDEARVEGSFIKLICETKSVSKQDVLTALQAKLDMLP